MYLPRLREFATLVMIATLYSPLAGSGHAWCDAWDCESPDATQEADLWDAFGLIYVHPEFQVCQEIYDAARGGLFSRDSDSTKILAAVVRGLTQGWDEDQVIVRARPRMAPFVRPVAEAVRASDNDCALLECVRSGRVVIELAALSVDGQGSVVHLGRVTLGPENQSHVELFKVTLSRTNRSGDWTIDQIERLAVG